jgi:glycosyltransferase involved in cell wall biosynthesis
MLGGVNNGITIDRFPLNESPISTREYLLWIGRICEEKGPHIALDLAHRMGERIIIAGQVYPFLYHQKYFAREIIPRLKRAGARARFINSPSFAEKVDLLGNARALLLTSLVDETSSLIAMEAGACGTPVFASRRGALPDVIAEGITGRLFDSEGEMSLGLSEKIDFDPQRSRQYAEENFSAKRMANDYHELYARLLHSTRNSRSELLLI